MPSSEDRLATLNTIGPRPPHRETLLPRSTLKATTLPHHVTKTARRISLCPHSSKIPRLQHQSEVSSPARRAHEAACGEKERWCDVSVSEGSSSIRDVSIKGRESAPQRGWTGRRDESCSLFCFFGGNVVQTGGGTSSPCGSMFHRTRFPSAQHQCPLHPAVRREELTTDRQLRAASSDDGTTCGGSCTLREHFLSLARHRSTPPQRRPVSLPTRECVQNTHLATVSMPRCITKRRCGRESTKASASPVA